MSELHILKVKTITAFALAIVAVLNLFFKAPKNIVFVYWLLVYLYWAFNCITEHAKIINKSKEERFDDGK